LVGGATDRCTGRWRSLAIAESWPSGWRWSLASGESCSAAV
jgi:hypothetical protein